MSKLSKIVQAGEREFLQKNCLVFVRSPAYETLSATMTLDRFFMWLGSPLMIPKDVITAVRTGRKGEELRVLVFFVFLPWNQVRR